MANSLKRRDAIWSFYSIKTVNLLFKKNKDQKKTIRIRKIIIIKREKIHKDRMGLKK